MVNMDKAIRYEKHDGRYVVTAGGRKVRSTEGPILTREHLWRVIGRLVRKGYKL